MAGVIDCITVAMRIFSLVILVIGLASIGLGFWTMFKAEGPLVDYLMTEQQKQEQSIDKPWYQIGGSDSSPEGEMTIQVVGGLLIGIGAILIIDFVLGMLASVKVLAPCCVPSFLAFAIVTTIISTGCGVAALLLLESTLRRGLTAVFENDLALAIERNTDPAPTGPLGMAEKNFDCCGPIRCTEYGITSDKYIHIHKYCLSCDFKTGCVDAVLNSYIMNYRLAFASGCFAVAGITTLMFLLSLILCCCNRE